MAQIPLAPRTRIVRNAGAEVLIDTAKQYSIFTGLLIGFSITFTTILLTSSSEEIKNNIFFEYAIAAFVISAFTFLQSTEFFIDFTGDITDIFYDIASCCYYIGYLSMVLGIVYLLKLFGINYALWISYFFLVVSFIVFIRDSIKLIFMDKNLYLFSWDNVPGNDNAKLRGYLRDDLDISWAENSKIHKPDDGKTIRIYKDKNSEDKNSAEIRIDEKGKKATLKISDGRTLDLKVKTENGKINIYKKLIDDFEKTPKASANTTEVYKGESVTRSKLKFSINIVCLFSISIIYSLVVYFTLIK